MTNERRYHSLKDISEWQTELNDKSKRVELPSLQRGFVWKPRQIEALWDSILRGYPIGAILMAIDSESGERLLLDGQQRSTSIALGFFNPFEEKHKSFLSLKNYLPSVWIDLQPHTKVPIQKYSVRVLTKSHPWGYQSSDNGKSLSMSDRRNAFAYFKNKQETESYVELLSSNINPWDSYYPVPLSFILSLEPEKEFENFKTKLKGTLSKLKVQTKYSKGNEVNYNHIKDDSFKLIFEGLKNAKELFLPEIQVKAEVLQEQEENEAESQDPTLFVRLNSAGTQISGEELNYSIYKAAFPKSKELVEKLKAAQYIPPSKIISLFARLVNLEQSFIKPYSVKEFRKRLKNDEYRRKVEQLISEEENCIAQKLIEKATDILRQGQNDFSNVLLKQIIVSDIDLFLALLAYIQKCETITDEEQNEISANYVYFLWFNRDKNKLHSKLFALLFKEKLSWNLASEKLKKEGVLLPLIQPELLREELLRIPETEKNFNSKDFPLGENVQAFLKIKEDASKEGVLKLWSEFVERIRLNKALLLYAQRNYLNQKFKEFNQIENIEDTNRPWDYDHIYPISWVYNKQNINHLVSNWVNSIGNFRALSYDDNRSENNHKSPRERFAVDEKKEESFVCDNDLEFWNQLDGSSERIKSNNIALTRVFTCAVIHRMVNIYDNWYSNYYQRK